VLTGILLAWVFGGNSGNDTLPGYYGPGVARDQMQRIFQLFYRAEDELTRQTKGTGIGLALVTALAVQMHAQVHLHNHHPGAEFQLIMPAIVGG